MPPPAVMLLLAAAGPFLFEPVAAESGIDFVHYNGASGRKYLVETMGGGVAWIDYDGDGLLDAYFVSGAPLPGSTTTTAPPVNRLYRNLGAGSFGDVTDAAGVGDKGYGLGCCVADYDNDGDSDLYITNYGANVLYRNDGGGTFTDVSREAGVGHVGFSAGSAFADFDNDGLLDLFVSNYVVLNLDDRPECSQDGIPAYCRPEDYPATLDVLYRNNGDGTFTDVSDAAGIAARGRGLGAVWGDFDADGFPDVFVANDRMANFLYRNRGDGSFEEIGEFAGVAYNEHGYSESGMGVAVGDCDGDGATDLFVTNYQAQTNTLYRNDGPIDGAGAFWDVTNRAGLGESSLLSLAWGAAFADMDGDGLLDLLVANGHLDPDIAVFEDVGTYRQPNQAYRNVGDGRFADVSRSAGAGLAVAKSSRGLAAGDYDNDGDVDALVGAIAEAADLLRNDAGGDAAWIGVALVGVRSNRDGIGARISVTAGERTQTRDIHSGGSYLSHGDMRGLFGLGTGEVVDRVRVRWPSGVVDEFDAAPTRSYLEVTEGSATPRRLPLGETAR